MPTVCINRGYNHRRLFFWIWWHYKILRDLSTSRDSVDPDPMGLPFLHSCMDDPGRSLLLPISPASNTFPLRTDCFLPKTLIRGLVCRWLTIFAWLFIMFWLIAVSVGLLFWVNQYLIGIWVQYICSWIWVCNLLGIFEDSVLFLIPNWTRTLTNVLHWHSYIEMWNVAVGSWWTWGYECSFLCSDGCVRREPRSLLRRVSSELDKWAEMRADSGWKHLM